MTDVLVACIGNIFFGDDGFGVEVARRLALRGRGVEGARVVDFGIRGFDLAMALSSDLRAAVLVDVVSRGGAPGTLYVLDPVEVSSTESPDGHGMHPLRAIALARTMGSLPATMRLVACEPASLEEEVGLSAPVEAAIEGAILLIEQVVREVSHA